MKLTLLQPGYGRVGAFMATREASPSQLLRCDQDGRFVARHAIAGAFTLHGLLEAQDELVLLAHGELGNEAPTKLDAIDVSKLLQLKLRIEKDSGAPGMQTRVQLFYRAEQPAWSAQPTIHRVTDRNGKIVLRVPRKTPFSLCLANPNGLFFHDYSAEELARIEESGGELSIGMDRTWIYAGSVEDQHGDPVPGLTLQLVPQYAHAEFNKTKRLRYSTDFRRVVLGADGRFALRVPTGLAKLGLHFTAPPNYRIVRDSFRWVRPPNRDRTDEALVLSVEKLR